MLMKNLFLVLLFVATTLKAQDSHQGISFETGTWSQIVSKAKKENKLIMLDAYASWCGPCKWMAKNIFPMKEVGDFYNKTFINAKIDMEKGEGVKLAEKYGIIAYPTFFFIDGSGKVVHQVCGGKQADEFIQSGKDALNVETRLSTLAQQFDNSPKDSKLALIYFNAAENACVDVEARVKKYTESISPSDLLDDANYQLVEKFISDYKHTTIKNIVSDYDRYTSKYGKDRIENKFKLVYSTAIMTACKSIDENQLGETQKSYRANKNLPVKWLDDLSLMMWSEAKADTSTYFQAATSFCDAYFKDDAQQLNSMAWKFYENTGNEKHLQKATEWVLRSIELERSYANLDTYASLLFKRGKLKDAKAVAEEAIALGKETNEEVKDTETLLEKINSKIKN